MRTRIHGLFIVITVLAPVIAVVVVAIASVLAVGSIRESGREYGAAVGSELDDAKAVFEDVGSALSDVGQFVSGVAKGVTDAVGELGDISTDVLLPVDPILIPSFLIVDLPDFRGVDMPFNIPDVPGLRFPAVVFPETIVLESGALDFTIPGVEPLGQFLADAAKVSREISADIESELSSLVGVPKPIENIAQATGKFADDVRSTVVRWFLVVLLVAILTLGAWINSKAAVIIGELRRGWAMMAGESPPAPTLDALREKLREIEGELAAMS